MKRHWSNIEPALPADVVASIWREVLAAGTPTGINSLTRAFAEIAIDYPHYATATEIAVALGETYNRINPMVHAIKDAARRKRLTTGT